MQEELEVFSNEDDTVIESPSKKRIDQHPNDITDGWLSS